MREEWAAAVRSRLSGVGGPYGLLDPAALSEAAELFACTTRSEDVPETCHLVGTLHWKRGLALSDDRLYRENFIAVPLLAVVHGSNSGLPLPEQLMQSFSKSGTTPEGQGPIWGILLSALHIWLQDSSDPYRLRLALCAARSATQDTPAGHPARARYLAFHCTVQRILFECSGDMAALEEAVAAGRSAVTEAHADDPNRAMYFSDLGAALRTRFERTGDVRSLTEAVEFGRSGARTTPEHHDQRHVPFANLATSLHMLYSFTGDIALLDEAAEVSSVALDAVPDGDQGRAGVLTGRSTVLRALFERSGTPSLLTEAVVVARGAAAESLSGTPVHWACLHNLSALRQAQFTHNGDLPALDEAIDLERRLVHALPDGHPDAPLYMSTLVGQLQARFQLSNDPAALDEAISWGETAVRAAPRDHPDRVKYLSNLALALRAQAVSTSDARVLGRAIELQRSAAAARGPLRATVLTNLSNSLTSYFEMTGDTATLKEAIDLGRAAVSAAPEDDPARSLIEVNLAKSLHIAGTDSGDDLLVDEAICLLEAAASRPGSRPGARVAAGRSWGVLAMQAGDAERAARGFALAVRLLPRLAARGLIRSDATRWLAEYSRLARDAAACALAVGRSDQAVELLETGRGVLLAQALESRTDLTELREQDNALADRFTYLCGRLDADETSGGPDAEGPDARRVLAGELEALIDRIRTLPRLDRFLLPPEVARLTDEAREGPIVMVNVSRYRCDALILTTDGVQVQELPLLNSADIRDRLTAMRTALGQTGSRDERRTAEETMHGILAWLWDAVTGPVLERLAEEGEYRAERVWWVPCGPLAYFPLHAAGHHRDAPTAERRTVLDRVVSSYSPTILALAHSRTRRASPSGSRPPRTLVVAMPRTPEASDLPGARREFEHLAGLLPSVEGLIGAEATREAVLSRLPDSAWAHFACHATGDPTDPARARLLVYDHLRKPLNVLELSRLRLERSEFAYLSACGTAITSADLTDESVHVVSAFQLAGYAHVVGTLWEIDDTVAAEMAESLYKDLATNGSDAGRAGVCLHRATLAIRDRYPSLPTLWASHVHTGA